MRSAQFLAAAQGALSFITGLNLIRGTAALSGVASGVNVADVSRGTTAAYGIAVVITGIVLVSAGFLMGRPSRVARAFLATFEAIAVLFTVAAFSGGGSVFGGVTVVVLAAGGRALLPGAAVLAVEAAIVYALAVHPPTYRSFAESSVSPSYSPAAPRQPASLRVQPVGPPATVAQMPVTRALPSRVRTRAEPKASEHVTSRPASPAAPAAPVPIVSPPDQPAHNSVDPSPGQPAHADWDAAIQLEDGSADDRWC